MLRVYTLITLIIHSLNYYKYYKYFRHVNYFIFYILLRLILNTISFLQDFYFNIQTILLTSSYYINKIASFTIYYCFLMTKLTTIKEVIFI